MSNQSEIQEEIQEETHEEPQEEPHEPPKNISVKEIPRKRIPDLTADEQHMLIEGAKRGEFNDNYKVKFFKNGNSRIVKNGSSLDFTPTQAPTQAPKASPQSVMSNDQFLMQHIIDLEARFAKMTMKHKKLKRKYNDLESNIYGDDEYIEESSKSFERSESPQETPQEIIKKPVYEMPQEIPHEMPIKARGWRATLMNRK